jgi:hypothetical protein
MLFGRNTAPNIWNGNNVTESERVRDIEQKLHQWGYLSHHPDAERDMAWLLIRLAELRARVTDLEGRLPRNDWIYFLP